MLDKLKECAISFGKLLDVEYYIIAGKKSSIIKPILFFHKEHFCHLMGLHKLRDIQKIWGNKEKVYDNIIANELTYQDISKSEFFLEIADRFDYFILLEQMLDSEDVLVKHNEFASKSNIKADYIIYKTIDNAIVHYFVSYQSDNGKYYGTTFFTRQDRLYLHNRPYKILKKTKIKNGCMISEVTAKNYKEII